MDWTTWPDSRTPQCPAMHLGHHLALSHHPSRLDPALSHHLARRMVRRALPAPVPAMVVGLVVGLVAGVARERTGRGVGRGVGVGVARRRGAWMAWAAHRRVAHGMKMLPVGHCKSQRTLAGRVLAQGLPVGWQGVLSLLMVVCWVHLQPCARTLWRCGVLGTFSCLCCHQFQPFLALLGCIHHQSAHHLRQACIDINH